MNINGQADESDTDPYVLPPEEVAALDVIAKKANNLALNMHCIYCHMKCRVILTTPRDPAGGAFIDWHEQHCGEKAVGGIIEFP